MSKKLGLKNNTANNRLAYAAENDNGYRGGYNNNNMLSYDDDRRGVYMD